MTLRRLLIGTLFVAALTAAPTTAISSAQPGPLAPFCLPGLVFDYLHTGLCVPAAPPPAPLSATP